MDDNFYTLVNRVKELNQSNSDPWPPSLQLIWIFEEIGELSGEILKLSKLKGRFSERKTSFRNENLTEEFGDIMYGLVSLTNNLDIDLLECLKYSINKFESRNPNRLS